MLGYKKMAVFLEDCREAQAGFDTARRVELWRRGVRLRAARRQSGRVGVGRPMDPATDQAMLTMNAWCADVYEDPSLVEQVVAWLDPIERAEFYASADKVKRPHPLELGRGKESHCAGCGTSLGESLTMMVGHQEGYTAPLEDGGAWCFECVTNVYEAMRAAQA